MKIIIFRNSVKQKNYRYICEQPSKANIKQFLLDLFSNKQNLPDMEPCQQQTPSSTSS